MTSLQSLISSRIFKRPSSNVLVILMFLMAGLPLSVAWIMVSVGWQPSSITSNGEFLSTPIGWQEIADVDFIGADNTWRLLVVESKCLEICEVRLENYRKMHVALGRQSSDLSRVLITAEPLASNDPFLYQLDSEHLLLTREQQLTNRVWLADPNGWVVMSFAADQPAAELHKDILKLLKSNPKG